MSYVAARRLWISDLRRLGVKAAHPDDGWVDRERNRIHLCYPQFDDGLEVGDLLALGWPHAPTRIVRVTGWEEPPICLGMRYWFFEAADPMPARCNTRPHALHRDDPSR